MVDGYDTMVDTETGKLLSIQRSTGEVFPTMTVTFPAGSIIYTPEQQEEYKRRKSLEEERKRKAEERRQWRKDTGQFIFVLEEYRDVALNPAIKARLLYLATYLTYDGHLALSQRTPMKIKDLKTVLNLSPTGVHRFLDAVRGVFITEDNQGRMVMQGRYFRKGKINEKARYQKFFIDAVRELYRNTAPRKHRYLGYIFQMLPFVNTEYNILCLNPTEKNNFCSAIGYNPANQIRLIPAYTEITFGVNGHSEQLCSFVPNNTNAGEAKIFINPHILYVGKSPQRVEQMGGFRKTKE